MVRDDRERAGTSPGPAVGWTARRAAWSAAVVGAVVVASGVVTASYVSDEVSELAASTIDTRTAALEHAARAEVMRYADALVLVGAALAAAPRVDADAFEVATAPLDAMRLAGATSLAFVAAPVGDADLDRFARTWEQRGSTGLLLAPAPGERTHTFAVLSTPLDGSTESRTGVDVAGAPAPYEALRESERSGSVAISDAYQLIIDQDLPESDRQTSFSVTAPVVRDGRLAGWVLMGLRGQDFLGSVLGAAAEGRAAVELVADDDAGVGTTVASVATGRGTTDETSALERTVPVVAAQHTWTLRVVADEPALVGPARHRPLAILFIAGVLAVLLAGLWWLLARGRARVEAQVRAATRELADAEAAARGQAEMLDTMVEAIDQVGVSVVDADGTFLVHSRTARRILGVESDDTNEPDEAGVGKAVAVGLGDVDDPAQWQRHYGMFHVDGTPFPQAEMPLLRALSGETTDAVEMVIRNEALPSGVRIAVSGRPLDLGGGRPGGLAVFRDVTDERRHEAELSGFAGMVAHDLKSPLAVAHAYLEIVLDDLLPALEGSPDLVATASTHLGKAVAATGRMAELIDDLLAYTSARDGSLQLADVDLGALVRETTVDVVAGHLAQRRALGGDDRPPQVHIGELPVVRCDAERMRQVVANLVGNALKYVQPGARAVLDITADATDAGVRLYVADRGIGVPAGLQTEVVKPFVRTPTTAADPGLYPGTGLGLAICARIAERHGGRLRLRSNPGGGTIAIVDLPSTTPEPPAPAAVAEPSDRPQRRPVVAT